MTDFSKTLFHPSVLSKIMVGKSPMDTWQKACDVLEQEKIKYEKTSNKETIPAKKKLEKITELEIALIELELHKNEDVISEGCKTTLAAVYVREKYHKLTIAVGEPIPQFAKGVALEDEAIKMVARMDKNISMSFL